MKFQFLHIEKTAGMSLHAMLHRDCFLYISANPRNVWDPDKKKWPLRDFSNGGHSIKRSERFEYQFTVLRDPVDRYISHYNWRTQVMGHAWTLEDFFSIERFRNFQWKKLSYYTGSEDIESVLAAFSLVGIFEEIEMTLGFLCRDLGITPELYQENRKTYDLSIRRSDLSDRQLSAAIENNRFDVQIYEQALSRLIKLGSPNVSIVKTGRVPNKVRFKQKAFNVLARVSQGVFWNR